MYAALRREDLDGDGVYEAGRVYMADLDKPAEEYGQALTGIPSEKLHDLPVTGQEMTLQALFHEACHLPKMTIPRNEVELAMSEINADNCSFAGLDQAEAEGGISNAADIKEFVYDARLVGSLGVQSLGGEGGKQGSHIAHVGMDTPNALPFTNGENIQAMTGVNRQFNALMGGYYVYEAQSAVAGQPDPASKEQAAAHYQLQTALEDPNARQSMGVNMAMADPAVAKAGLETLRTKGYIPDDTPEAAYADRILDFYDNHVDTTQGSEWRGALVDNYMNAVPQAPMYTPAPAQQPAAPTTAAPSQTMRGMEF